MSKQKECGSQNIKKGYYKKLKDPRWQKLRLNIFERDEWRCRWCGSKNRSLNIHHIVYSSKFPWEEKKENLETVCDGCHKLLHEDKLIYVPVLPYGSEGFEPSFQADCPNDYKPNSCMSGSGSSLCLGYFGPTIGRNFMRCTWKNGGVGNYEWDEQGDYHGQEADRYA